MSDNSNDNDPLPDCWCTETIGHSCSIRPAVPPGGGVNDLFYECDCGRRWLQFNDHFHLWKEVKSDEEWSSWQGEALGYDPEDTLYNW